VIILILILCLLLASCSADSTSIDNRHANYYTSYVYDEGNHSYRMETDSLDPIDFKIRISYSDYDTNCEKAIKFASDSVSAIEPSERYFDFNSGSGKVALHEWHMCFIHDGTTYKAWRGFDPGPNTSLDVRCFFPSEQLAAKETDKYLCKTKTVTHSDSDYSEFSQYCWSKGLCRRFETEYDYNLFLNRGPENAALYKIVPSKEIRKAIVNYEYIDVQQAEKLRSTRIAEMERFCAEIDDRDRPACLEELTLQITEMEALLADGGAWRYRITEQSLINSFAELTDLAPRATQTSTAS